jgi:hypothetical protein
MALRPYLLALALLAPATLAAQPPAPAQRGPFDSLWTSWNGTNRQAMLRENEAIEQVRRDVATADAARQAALRDQGRALGERVGEIVRGGDCEDGERVAREAGDFALVEAVRDYCRQRRPRER